MSNAGQPTVGDALYGEGVWRPQNIRLSGHNALKVNLGGVVLKRSRTLNLKRPAQPHPQLCMSIIYFHNMK